MAADETGIQVLDERLTMQVADLVHPIKTGEPAESNMPGVAHCELVSVMAGL